MNGEQAPAGSKLTDMNNNEKVNSQKVNNLKLLYLEKYNKDVSIDITATGNVETFPVFIVNLQILNGKTMQLYQIHLYLQLQMQNDIYRANRRNRSR